MSAGSRENAVATHLVHFQLKKSKPQVPNSYPNARRPKRSVDKISFLVNADLEPRGERKSHDAVLRSHTTINIPATDARGIAVDRAKRKPL